MTLQATHVEGTEFLEILAKEANWTPKEIEDTAAAWGVLQVEVDAWKENHKSQQIDHWECEVRTAITAAQSAYVLEHRAQVTTPEIANANEEEIQAFAEWYDTQLRGLYKELTDREKLLASKKKDKFEDEYWARKFAEFFKLAAYLWQCRRLLRDA